MFWPPRDTYPYDDVFQPPRDRERLRHLIFLDGRLVDTWSEPVETTVYRELAEEFDQEKLFRHPVHEPPPPPYEQVLSWLDATVGGRVALLALDDEPLHDEPLHDEPLRDEPLRDGPLRGEPPGDAQAAANDTVVGFLEMVAKEFFDPEFLAATRNALATIRREDQSLLREAPAIEVAAGLCWVVGRANGVVGAGTGVTQQALKRILESRASPSRRVPRLKSCLRGLSADPRWRPSECPDLLELGSPVYLTSRTRRRLIVLRDRALAAAERAEADEQARAALRT